jgi:DNA modification methylase
LYDSKYAKHEYGQTLQAFVREQSIAKRRILSRVEAEKLFPNDHEKQQEFINYIHDHDGHPQGKNPSDVLKFKGDETKNAGRLARSRELYREQGLPEGNPLGMNPSDFWTINTKPFKGAHFAVYPEEVCIRPVLSSCPPDGIVLDPLCGSGTTLAVAKKLGRKYIGIELNAAYIEIAKKRLSEIPEKISSFL